MHDKPVDLVNGPPFYQAVLHPTWARTTKLYIYNQTFANLCFWLQWIKDMEYLVFSSNRRLFIEKHLAE